MIIDPRCFPIPEYPMITLADNLRGFLSLGIKRHTKGNYSHVMWLIDPDTFLSQDPGYGFREVPVLQYLKPHYRLKFLKPILTQEQTGELYTNLLDKVAKGVRYDFLGIIGQKLGLPWVQAKNREYCSEGISQDLRDVDFSIDFGRYPSPASINKIAKQHKDKLILKGYWFYD